MYPVSQTLEVSIPGGDHIALNITIDGGSVANATWKVVGRLELLEEIQNYKTQMRGEIAKLPVPNGTSMPQLMLKKLILQLKGQWPTAPSDPELCHCRKIPQEVVERAIILGAHTVEKVRQRTSANTGCGTCLPDVEKILSLYLG